MSHVSLRSYTMLVEFNPFNGKWYITFGYPPVKRSWWSRFSDPEAQPGPKYVYEPQPDVLPDGAIRWRIKYFDSADDAAGYVKTTMSATLTQDPGHGGMQA